MALRCSIDYKIDKEGLKKWKATILAENRANAKRKKDDDFYSDSEDEEMHEQVPAAQTLNSSDRHQRLRFDSYQRRDVRVVASRIRARMRSAAEAACAAASTSGRIRKTSQSR